MEAELPEASAMPDLNLKKALLTRNNWLLPGNDHPVKVLHALTGGLSNNSFLLQVGNEQLVLRLPNQVHDNIWLDNANELAVHSNAANMGIAVNIVYAEPEQGILVTRYISDAICMPENVNLLGFIELLARLLKQVHVLEPPVTILNPEQRVQHYLSKLEQQAKFDLNKLNYFISPMYRLMKQEWQQSYVHCCCHNDLVLGNILHHNHYLLLLDWEYAALGNPYFDLAALTLNFNMTHIQSRHLLMAYERDVLSLKCEQRLISNQAIYLYLELLWYQLHGIIEDKPKLLVCAEQRKLDLMPLLNKLAF